MLKSYISKESVLINPHVSNKEELFELMAKKAHEHGLSNSVENMVEQILEKEKINITELIPHVVLPHARGDFAQKLFVMFAISKEGFAYKGAKQNKVHLAVLIGVPSQNRDYLKLLASISRLLSKSDFLEEIINANVTEDVFFTLKKFTKVERAEDTENKKKNLVILTINKDCDSQRISPLLTEVGIDLATEIEGKNLCHTGSFFSFFTTFGYSHTFNQYSKIYYGITGDSDAAVRLNSLLKEEEIDLSESGAGSLLQIALAESFGGFGEDVNF